MVRLSKVTNCVKFPLHLQTYYTLLDNFYSEKFLPGIGIEPVLLGLSASILTTRALSSQVAYINLDSIIDNLKVQ